MARKTRIIGYDKDGQTTHVVEFAHKAKGNAGLRRWWKRIIKEDCASVTVEHIAP